MKKGIILLGVLVIVVGGIVVYKHNHQQKSQASINQASVRFSWIPSASFAGDIAGINKFAASHNLQLKAEFGGEGINTAQMVQSGQNTFGYLASDEVFAANDKGADFVILGVINYYSPAGFVSMPDKNIKTPKDLEGKKVGMLPYGDVNLIYENMLKKNGVDRSKIREITVSADLKSFISGAYDVHPVFVYDETVTLDQQHIKYNMIEPKDFGVTNIKGPVYFTKRETLEKNPEMVKAFVDTMADGWNFALKNPDTAIGMLKTFAPEIDENREKAVLLKGTPYFEDYNDQPLNSDTESWKSMVQELKDAGSIKNDVDLTKVLRLQYINDYYSKK